MVFITIVTYNCKQILSACRLDFRLSQFFFRVQICAKSVQKPDISDILNKYISDLVKSSKIGLLRAFAITKT